MPYLKIQCNQSVPEAEQEKIIKGASSLVAKEVGKPERYVMVAFDPALPMVFAGNDDPCAYLELKSIGLPQAQTTGLSNALCEFIHRTLNIATDRIYIEFTDAPRAMWGWNKGTF
jgi:phenylpyruvate tautomerase